MFINIQNFNRTLKTRELISYLVKEHVQPWGVIQDCANTARFITVFVFNVVHFAH